MAGPHLASAHIADLCRDLSLQHEKLAISIEAISVSDVAAVSLDRLFRSSFACSVKRMVARIEERWT